MLKGILFQFIASIGEQALLCNNNINRLYRSSLLYKYALNLNHSYRKEISGAHRTQFDEGLQGENEGEEVVSVGQSSLKSRRPEKKQAQGLDIIRHGDVTKKG